MSIIAYETFNSQSISILEYNNDYYFHALSTAKALKYQEPKTAVRDFIHRRLEQINNDAVFVEPLELGNLSVSAIGTVPINYSNATNVFLNFKALSLFIDYSQAPGASLLKQQLASGTHKSFIKEQNSQQIQVLSVNDSLALVESLNKQIAYTIEISKIQEQRIQALEVAARTFAIDRFQRKEIHRQIQQIAYMVAELEGKEKPDRIIYAKLWSNFNDHFNIASYHDLPKERYAEALELLADWREKLS